jgi:hypothetical protein
MTSGPARGAIGVAVIGIPSFDPGALRLMD